MKPEATLYICICKRVYIFLYNYAFWRFVQIINQFKTCSDTSLFNHQSFQ
jgi:hypothetical protein